MAAAASTARSLSASPVQPPATRLSPNAPSGGVSATVDCCPQVITFGFSGAANSAVYGFDDRSNKPARPEDAYWEPPTKAKKLPSNRETRDGAVWVSVPLGGEVDLMVFLEGCATASNCSYEVVGGPGVVEVLNPKPAGNMATLKIKGAAEGEASVKVSCRGKVIGYFHVWCKKLAKLRLGVGIIKVTSAKHKSLNLMRPDDYMVTGPLPSVSGLSLPPMYEIPGLSKAVNATFKQALIEFDVQDLGLVDFDQLPGPIRAKARNAAFDGPNALFGADGAIDERVGFDEQISKQFVATLATLTQLADAQVGGGLDYNIWYIRQPNAHALKTLGAAVAKSSRDAGMFAFGPHIYSVLVHELGHMMGLSHVNEPRGGNETDLPEHLRYNDPKGAAWHPDDPTNAMGYNDPQNVDLLYRQWKKVARTPPAAPSS